MNDAKWKHSVCHFHWGAPTQPSSMESTVEHFLDINMHHLHESELFLWTGAIKIPLLSFYLSLLLAKVAGRFIWEFFLHGSRERAQIWGLGTLHCLWDRGTEITRQPAASSKLFKGMINVLPLLFPLEPSQPNQNSPVKKECFLWCVGDVRILQMFGMVSTTALQDRLHFNGCVEEMDRGVRNNEKDHLKGWQRKWRLGFPEICGAAWL